MSEVSSENQARFIIIAFNEPVGTAPLQDVRMWLEGFSLQSQNDAVWKILTDVAKSQRIQVPPQADWGSMVSTRRR